MEVFFFFFFFLPKKLQGQRYNLDISIQRDGFETRVEVSIYIHGVHSFVSTAVGLYPKIKMWQGSWPKYP